MKAIIEWKKEVPDTNVVFRGSCEVNSQNWYVCIKHISGKNKKWNAEVWFDSKKAPFLEKDSHFKLSSKSSKRFNAIGHIIQSKTYKPIHDLYLKLLQKGYVPLERCASKLTYNNLTIELPDPFIQDYYVEGGISMASETLNDEMYYMILGFLTENQNSTNERASFLTW